MEFPNKSTIMYSTERGTDDWPDDPSRPIPIESDDSAANAISCGEGVRSHRSRMTMLRVAAPAPNSRPFLWLRRGKNETHFRRGLVHTTLHACSMHAHVHVHVHVYVHVHVHMHIVHVHVHAVYAFSLSNSAEQVHTPIVTPHAGISA